MIEVNPSNFLDIKLTNINGTYKSNVYQKNTKPPSPWTAKTPKCYKRNTMNGDLHRSKRRSSSFDEEILLIKEKFRRLVTHWVSLTVSVMNFKRVKNVEMKVLQFQLVCLKLQNLSYMKYPTVN